MEKGRKTFSQFVNELTIQIFADRYNMNLKLKEINKNNEERIILINCDNKMSNQDKKRDIANPRKMNNAPLI